MPPKGSRKRAHSADSNVSLDEGRHASSPPASLPSLSTEFSTTSSAPAPALRQVSEWQELHARAVLALKPTAAMLAHCARCTSPTADTQTPSIVKIAAFDLDDTIIMPKTGKVFAKDDPDDWRWLVPQVPDYLRTLHACGFLVVFLSNQSGIFGKGTWNASKADALKEKVVRVGQAAQVPLSCFFATQSASAWRKPNTGLWGTLQEAIEEVAASSSLPALADGHSASFYVGDAAGRHVATLAGRKKDFSCSDRALAANLSLPFFTPEQFFLSPLSDILVPTHAGSQDRRLNPQWVEKTHNQDAGMEIHWDTVSPDELRAMPTSYDHLAVTQVTSDGTTTFTTGSPASFACLDKQEMIIFVGYPGCGKSTFFRRFFQPHGYVHVNRDTLKTKEKCFAVAQACWRSGKSVVIDNTNPSSADRAYFANIALEAPASAASGKPTRACAVRVFEFVASRGMAAHMSSMRCRLDLGVPIPSIAYNLFQSKHEPIDSPVQVKKERLTAALLIPPVADFDGLPPAASRVFFTL